MRKRFALLPAALVLAAAPCIAQPEAPMRPSVQTLKELLSRALKGQATNQPTNQPPPRPGVQPQPSSPSQPPQPGVVQEQARNAPPPFQPGRYDGPPRWTFDAQFAEKIARLRVFSSGKERDQYIGGDAMQALLQYRLNLQRQSSITFRDVMAQLAVPATLLDCEYRRTEPTATEAGEKEFKPEYIKIFYWQAGTRQALNAQMLKPYQNASGQIADVERDACPADFASALTAAYGEGAWVAPTQLALQARNDEVRKNIDTGIWYAADYSKWADAPKALKPEEDRALAQEIDKVLVSLEAQGKFPKATAYYTALNQQLQPAMAKLAASGVAQAQAIAKGEAGRKAFEKWDAGIGITVMSLTMRVHRWGQPGNLFIGVLGKYMNLYAEQFADKGALDRKYYGEMMASIAKYRVEQAAAAAAAPTAESQRSASVWVMRPRQSALYRMVNSAVQIGMAYTQARAKIDEYISTMDREIKRTRQEFWACYEKRCPEGGRLYLEFSMLVNDWDRFLIGRTALEGRIGREFGDARHGETAMQLLGMNRDVENKFPGACDAVYDRFLGQFVTWLSLDATTMRRKLDEALAGDDYLQVQQCRDEMEFIMRPRSQKPGLL